MDRPTRQPGRDLFGSIDAALAQAMTGAGNWRWSQADPDRLQIQWPGSSAYDLRSHMHDEHWRLLGNALQQALQMEQSFRYTTELNDGSRLELAGGVTREGDDGAVLLGLCWTPAEEHVPDSREQFLPLAKLSHELRSPLAAVSELVRDARIHSDNAEVADNLDSAYESCVYMLRLIEDMLAAFRAGAPSSKRSAQPVDSRRLVTQLIPVARDRAMRKGLRFSLDWADSFPSCFLAEPVALRRVLQNLLDNAVKYTQQGQVTVRLIGPNQRHPDTLLFEVEDTGPGLTHAEIERIFQLFARGQAAGQAQEAGLGLGLTLSRQLAQALGGELRVDSQPGRGSCFRLSIPARGIGLELPEKAPDRPDAAGPRMAGKRVLLVDDHPLLARMTGKALRKLGCEVALAGTAGETFGILEHQVPDVIILDLDLPDMSGTDLCRALMAREQLAHCRFVAYSGSEELCDRRTAEQAGFHAYFVKPTPAEQLLGS